MDFLMYIAKNESSICAIDAINKIHNKGARLKHRRVERNKLDPFFLLNQLNDENEDSVPSLLTQQPLDSILEKETTSSGEHEVETQHMTSSIDSSKLSTPHALPFPNTSAPYSLSTK